MHTIYQAHSQPNSICCIQGH